MIFSIADLNYIIYLAKSTEAEPVMDPRAGNVSVEIPQLDVDYAKISKKLFELGSSNSTTIIQSCREEIYRLSESFKSVAEGVFPLTDEIADAEVEEINLEEEVAKYLKREEKILKKVEKETAEFEEVMKLRKEEERKAYEARMLEGCIFLKRIIVKNISSSTSHKKIYGNVKLWDIS